MKKNTSLESNSKEEKQWKLKKFKKLTEEEKKNLKDLHYMRCPKCGMELIEIEFKGIKIDKCFQCDGIWLDSGEMDALSKLEKTMMDKLFRVFKK